MADRSSNASAKRFRPAIDVTYAKLLPGQPAFIKRKRSRGRYAVGVRYERQVHDELSLLALGRPGIKYVEGPWFEFKDRNGKRWCQADGILIDDNQKALCIYEVKYQHCLEAYFQLYELYYPVVKIAFPGYHPIVLVEVVHWHDPQICFPQRYDLTDSPFRVPHSNKIAVWIFNPRARRRSENGVATAGHNGSQGGGQTAGGQRNEKRANGSDGAAAGLHRGVVQSGGSEVPTGAKGTTE